MAVAQGLSPCFVYGRAMLGLGQSDHATGPDWLLCEASADRRQLPKPAAASISSFATLVAAIDDGSLQVLDRPPPGGATDTVNLWLDCSPAIDRHLGADLADLGLALLAYDFRLQVLVLPPAAPWLQDGGWPQLSALRHYGALAPKRVSREDALGRPGWHL